MHLFCRRSRIWQKLWKSLILLKKVLIALNTVHKKFPTLFPKPVNKFKDGAFACQRFPLLVEPESGEVV